MGRVTDNDHIERLGIAEMEKICARGKQVFREVQFRDVGIDGFIEVVTNGEATGVLIGVQVKTGKSYVAGNSFRLKADRSHLIYWAGCAFPIVGVVHDPDSSRTAWVDITGACTDERIKNGPFVLTGNWDRNTTLTPQTLISNVLPTALEHLGAQAQRTHVRERIAACKAMWARNLPSQKPSSDDERYSAWIELVEYLMSPTTSIDEIADIAYRLSWYIPKPTDPRYGALVSALQECSDHQFLRLLAAANHANEIAGEYAEHVVGVIEMVPDAVARIESLVRAKMLPSEIVDTAVMAIEMITGDERQDLWSLVTEK